MKAFEKALLLIRTIFAYLRHGIKNAGKYMERNSKRAIAVFAAVFMTLSIIPMTAFADADVDHATHSGCKALSMGETYITVDGVEQENNRLSDGHYYLTSDITVTLTVNGNVSLCLNGHSINAVSRGIDFYTSDTSLTVDDCVGTSKISANNYAIYSSYSNTAVTLNGGIIGSDSCSYGIFVSRSSAVYINGGSVIGRSYGVYNASSDNKVYLSGTPVITGGTADICDGKIYADNGAKSPVPYSGETITLRDYEDDYHYHGDVMVSHVTEANKELFALSPDFTKFALAYDGDANVLKLEGETIRIAWYAEDGTTVLNGADYPTAMHYGEAISPMPAYEKEGYTFLGWRYRSVGNDEWSYDYYKNEVYEDRDYKNVLRNSMEFKADILSKHLFEGEGTADSPYLIQSADDLITLEQVTKNRYEYYNAGTVYYQLTTDIDLSSVCSEEKGNWTPIGSDESFRAQFDGNGHMVSNLYYNKDNSYIGLFGKIAEGSSVRNLTVTGFVSARDYFSGIVGLNYNGTVENCLDLTKMVPYGYTTDENGWMAFRDYKDTADFDVKAFYDGNWIKTSYSSSKQYEVKTSGLDGADVSVNPTIINGGAYIKVLYTVTNNGDTAITDGKLAVHSDIQIGDNDEAAIELIRNGDGKAIGFKMVDDHTMEKKKDCISRGAQLNLYFAGTGGVTNADTYWFGHYGDKEKNAFETISDKTASVGGTYEKDENGNYIKLSNVDSGIAFSWQNIELAAGESKEFSWVINVGTEAEPPQWGDAGVNLTITADATQNNRKINVAAKVKDEAGIVDKLYYSFNNDSSVLLSGVIADGETEKSITSVIDTSTWSDGTYHLDFWVVNSKGAVSEKVRRSITIANGEITGDITVLHPELSHDWDTAWSYDETNHWHDCKNANCTISDNADKKSFAAHDFDSDCDDTCNTCGYTRTVTHTFTQKVMTERYLASAGTCTQKAKYYFSCTCGAKGTTTFFGDTAAHEYVYSANDAVITETCAGDCGHKATATLIAPENRTYDGTAKEASVSYSNDWKGGTLTATYGSHGNVNVGTVTASIVKNGKKAMLSYDITVADVVVTPPAAVENLVYDGNANPLISAGCTTGGTMQYAIGDSADTAPAGKWSSDIPRGKAAGTYYVWYKVAGGTNYKDTVPACITVKIAKAKITVTADNKTKTYGDNDPAFTWRVTEGTMKQNDTLTGISLSRRSGENVNDYTVTVTQSAGSNSNYDITFVDGKLTIVQKEIGIRWSNTSLIYNGAAQNPSATATGVVNGDQISFEISGAQTDASDTAYTAIVMGIVGAKAGNYKLPAEKTTKFTIAKADQAAPSGIGKTDESVSKKSDGAITGVTVAMEYRKEGENTYTGVKEGVVGNLASGTYYVRMKGDGNHKPSAESSVTIAAGRKLKIFVPTSQIGYTLTSNVYEVDYLGAATLTFTLAEGYSKTANFAVSLNGNSDADWVNSQLPLSGISNDVNITVSGVADITAPTAEIKVEDNKWTSFLNKITFGLFFKETQSVSITVDDKGSGVDKIQYYVSGEPLKQDELSGIADWKDYNEAFSLNPNNRYVVYARVTDKAGNILYISSDGLVFDSVAPAFYDIENGGVYYGDKGLRVFDEQHYPISFTVDGVNVTDQISDDEYIIAADNKEHTLVATDKAGNVTEYKITVYKNYTITFMDENGVYKVLTCKHGETVVMPDVPKKDGYSVKWETTVGKAVGDATIKAVYTIIPKEDNPSSPKTGDDSSLWLWIVLMFVSGSTVIALDVYDKKIRR